MRIQKQFQQEQLVLENGSCNSHYSPQRGTGIVNFPDKRVKNTTEKGVGKDWLKRVLDKERGDAQDPK